MTPVPIPIADRDELARDAALRAANGGRRTARGGRGARGQRASWLWEWIKVFPGAVVLFLVLQTFLVEAYKIPSGSMERTLLVGDFLLVNKLVYGAELPFSHTRLPGLRTPQHGDVVVFEWPVDPSKNFVKRLVGLPGDTLAMRGGVLLRNGVALTEEYAQHSQPGVDPLNNAFGWQRSYLVAGAREARARDVGRAAGDAVADAGQNPARDQRDAAVLDSALVRAAETASNGGIAVQHATAAFNLSPSTAELGGDTPLELAGEGYRPSRNNWGPLVVPTKHLFMLGDNRDNSDDSRYWGFVPDSLVRGTPLVVYYSFAPDSATKAPWLTRIRWNRMGSAVH